jgi:uncharacterized paraquat-inducible protein A
MQSEEKRMSKQEKSGDKSGSGDVKGEENLFICPMCEAEHAVPGQESGAELMCPKCTIPLKAKPVK